MLAADKSFIKEYDDDDDDSSSLANEACITIHSAFFIRYMNACLQQRGVQTMSLGESCRLVSVEVFAQIVKWLLTC